MRLLNVYTLEFQEFPDERTAPLYMVASHRWTNDEISYQQFLLRDEFSDVRARSGYGKVRKFCRFVRKCRTDQGKRVKWLWIDTICINKSDFSELHEAINCMFRWYESAYACVAYLHDVPNSTAKQYHLEQSVWFRRGWTLQELLAPKFVFFVCQDWAPIGYKGPLMQRTLRKEYREPVIDRPNEYEALGPNLNPWVTRATAIPEHVLLDYSTADALSITEKRAWMVNRKCTRVEDESYCLLGMCGVYLPLIYGERERAATRLDEEILRQSRAQQQDRAAEISTSPQTIDNTRNITKERIPRPYGISDLRHPNHDASETTKDFHGTDGDGFAAPRATSAPSPEKSERTSYRSADIPDGSQPQSDQAPETFHSFMADFGGSRVHFATGPAAKDDAFDKHFKDLPRMHRMNREADRGRQKGKPRSGSQRRSSSNSTAAYSNANYRYFDDDGRQTRPSTGQDTSSCTSSSRSPSPALHTAARSGRDNSMDSKRQGDDQEARKNVNRAAALLAGIAATASLLKARKNARSGR